MKRKLYIIILVVVSGLIGLLSLSNSKSPDGSPAGNTGSPGDGQSCTHCHGGTAAVLPNMINSNIPLGGYVPGSTYTMVVTVPGTGNENKGFEVSPQNASGTLLGTLTAGSGSKLVGSNKYMTQSSPQTTNPGVWTFSWKAPTAGTGAVTFYGALVAGFSHVFTTSLTVQESTVGINEIVKSFDNLDIYPNPLVDRINITYNVNKSSFVKANIFSYDGKIVANLINEYHAAGNYKKSFSLPEQMMNGLYFVRIEDGDNNVVTRKLFKL